MSETNLKRFGVSLEEGLLNNFDLMIEKEGYTNRSEAIRDLSRDSLVKNSLEKSDDLILGSILIFYDHHKRNLSDELTRVQHKKHDIIISTSHFHLDHVKCLELIIVKGIAREVQELINQLKSIKGAHYVDISSVKIGNL